MILKLKKKCILLISLLILITCVGCTKKVENEEISFDLNDEYYDGKFTGELVDDKPEGKGKVIVKEKNQKWEYDGEFKKGEIKGKGKLKKCPYEFKYNDKKIKGIYSGNVKDGLPSGEGKFKSNDEGYSFTYEGDWKKGEIKGEGILEYDKYIYKNKDKELEGLYIGKVKDGMAHGAGRFTTNSDEEIKYTAEWENGLLNGEVEIEKNDNKYVMTFKKGELKPTCLELFDFFSLEEPKFDMEQETIDFINKHTDLFVTKDYKKISKYVDKSVTMKKVKKTSKKYNNKLMELKNYEVMQINESEINDDDVVTVILATDANYEYYCYIYYLGELKNVYEDSKITCYGIPAANSGFENVGGGTTNCTVILASMIK